MRESNDCYWNDGYEDDYPDMVDCGTCDWSGTEDELTQESDENGASWLCPNCGSCLTFVSFHEPEMPTWEEQMQLLNGPNWKDTPGEQLDFPF